MSQWVNRANRNAFSLMVSIPRNHSDMAKAAEAGGADAIKVHLNCKHPASGFVFGSFKQERKGFEKILKSIRIPLGVVPGDLKPATVMELQEMMRMGFDFFDIFAHHMPLDYLDLSLGKMVCIDSRYSPNDVKQLADSGVEVFEASVIPHEGYGKSVVLADLVRWKELTRDLAVPVMVSTQRKIKPEECGKLRDAGARGVVIGIVVTGNSVKGVEQVTASFRKEISKL